LAFDTLVLKDDLVVIMTSGLIEADKVSEQDVADLVRNVVRLGKVEQGDDGLGIERRDEVRDRGASLERADNRGRTEVRSYDGVEVSVTFESSLARVIGVGL
jgi:hypothetical protein